MAMAPAAHPFGPDVTLVPIGGARPGATTQENPFGPGVTLHPIAQPGAAPSGAVSAPAQDGSPKGVQDPEFDSNPSHFWQKGAELARYAGQVAKADILGSAANKVEAVSSPPVNPLEQAQANLNTRLYGADPTVPPLEAMKRAVVAGYSPAPPSQGEFVPPAPNLMTGEVQPSNPFDLIAAVMGAHSLTPGEKSVALAPAPEPVANGGMAQLAHEAAQAVEPVRPRDTPGVLQAAAAGTGHAVGMVPDLPLFEAGGVAAGVAGRALGLPRAVMSPLGLGLGTAAAQPNDPVNAFGAGFQMGAELAGAGKVLGPVAEKAAQSVAKTPEGSALAKTVAHGVAGGAGFGAIDAAKAKMEGADNQTTLERGVSGFATGAVLEALNVRRGYQDRLAAEIAKMPPTAPREIGATGSQAAKTPLEAGIDTAGGGDRPATGLESRPAPGEIKAPTIPGQEPVEVSAGQGSQPGQLLKNDMSAGGSNNAGPLAERNSDQRGAAWVRREGAAARLERSLLQLPEGNGSDRGGAGGVPENSLDRHVQFAPEGYRQLRTRVAGVISQRVFGKDLVPIRVSDPVLSQQHGFFDPNQPDFVFWNVDSKNPISFTVGHELLHAVIHNLGFDAPSSQRYLSTLSNAFIDRDAALDWQRQAERAPNRSEAKALEEFAADHLGKNIASPDFWLRLKAQDEGLFGDFARRFIRVVDRVREALPADYDIDRHLKAESILPMRDELVRLVAEHRRQRMANQTQTKGDLSSDKIETGQKGRQGLLTPAAASANAGQLGAVGPQDVYKHPGDSREHPITYRVREASDLIPSNDPQTFAPRSDYARELQPRDYERDPNEKAKVITNANQLDPRLLVTRDLGPENGPPLVTPEGFVLGGNGRTMSIQRAIESNPDYAKRYREYLEQHAGDYGVSPQQISEMRNPVLVRELTDLPRNQWAEFADRANDIGTKALDLNSQAISTARRMKTGSLSELKLDDDTSLREAFSDPKISAEFVQSLRESGTLTPQNAAVYVDAHGRLTDVGKALLEQALFAKVFEGPQQREAMTFFDDNRAMRRAVMQALPPLVRLKEMVDSGRLPAGYDISAPLYRLAREMSEKQVASYDELMRTQDFVSPTTEEAAIIGRKLGDVMTKPNKLRDAIEGYVADAAAAEGSDNAMFAPLSPLEILRAWADPNYEIKMSRRRKAEDDLFGVPREQLGEALPRPQEEASLDLADLMREQQDYVMSARTADTQQGDLFSGAMQPEGNPSAEAKVGSSRAPKNVPDMFGPSASAARTPLPMEKLPEYLQRARDEKPGEFATGRPDLALGASNEVIRATDQLCTDVGQPRRRSDKDVRAEADVLLQDRAAVRRALISRAESGDQLSDAETDAGRRLVVDETFTAAASGKPEEIQNAAELVDAWRRIGTEQARSFRQRRDNTMTPDERKALFLARALVEPRPAAQEALDKLDGLKAERKITAEAHARRRKQIIEREAATGQRSREALQAAGIDPQNLNNTISNPDKYDAAMRAISAARASMGDKLFEYWVNSVLSSPKTQVANVLGNMAHMGWDMTGQRFMEATINLVARDPNSPEFRDYKEIAQAVLPAIKTAARTALQAFRREQPVLDEEILGRGRGIRREESHGPAISGVKGQAIRTPSRLLLAMDQFFKAFSVEANKGWIARKLIEGQQREGGGELAPYTMDQLMNSPDSPAAQLALELANYQTFQQQPGRAGQAFIAMRNAIPGGRYVVPFPRTINNIFKIGMRKSPLGSIGMAMRLGNQGLIEMGLKSGGWEYSKKEFVRDAAEQVFAWGLASMLASVLGGKDEDGQPRITGTVPFGGTSKGEREAALRTAAPMTVSLGGKRYSYARIEPVATTLATTIDMINALQKSEKGQPFADSFGNLHRHLMGQIKDKSFMSGISDLLDAIENEKSIAKYAGNFASSWMPNLVRSAGNAADATLRNSRVWGEGADWWQRYSRATLDRAYPFGNRPMARTTPWGEDIKTNSLRSPASDFVYRMVSPVDIDNPSDARNPLALRLDRMIVNFNNKYPDAVWWPAQPEPSITRDGAKVWMNDEQYYRFTKRAGELALERLDGMQFDPERPTLRDIERVKDALQDGQERAKNESKGEMRDEIREKQESRRKQTQGMVRGE